MRLLICICVGAAMLVLITAGPRLLTAQSPHAAELVAVSSQSADSQDNAGEKGAPADDFLLNEFPSRPAPDWVQMIDAGTLNPQLAGISVPRGLGVEIVAQEPTVINPVGMAFAADGTPQVLEWLFDSQSGQHATYEVTFQDGTKTTIDRMQKSVRDQLKTLSDANGDGVYDTTHVLMNDLEIPSSLLLHDGWTYLSSVGRIFRRRPDGNGGWEEQTIVQGLCGFHHHQASGMTLGADSWLYITSGDDDNRGEGSDGSRATVLRTGVVYRCRPDGSQLHEFARGFRNPYRDIAFDEFFNVFHVDNDQEDGSRFQGVRVMHIQEGDDFGWRLMPGTVCCQTDFSRAAVFGERPGTVPSLLKTGRGSPAGLLIYNGTAFPEFFRGLLIYPDVYRKLVRAYEIRRHGSSFEVVRQFDLMRGDDPLFRPCQAVIGPDGAIYIVDWRTDSGGAGRLSGDGQHGRIYRLTWNGTETSPAIAAGSLNAWAELKDKSDDELLALFASPDFELRRRAQRELVSRGEGCLGKLIALLQMADAPATAKALALGGIAHFSGANSENALLGVIEDSPEPELRRLAAETLARNATWQPFNSPVIVTRLRERLAAAEALAPFERRAMVLAYANLAALAPDNTTRQQAAETLFAGLQQALPQAADDPHLVDGYVRALETLGTTGLDVLAAQAVARNDTSRETAIRALEACRTREAAAAFDELITSHAAELPADQLRRLIVAYRFVQLDPPIGADAVARFALSTNDAPAEIQLAALETIGLTGTRETFELSQLALPLLKSDDATTRLATIAAIGNANLVTASAALADALAENDRSAEERAAIIRTLAQLRSRPKPFTGEPSPPGVETVIDRLVRIIDDPQAPSGIRGDILRLVGQVQVDQAYASAQRLLASDDLSLSAAAVDVLAADAGQSIQLAEAFVAGQADRRLLPQIAGALRRHAAGPQAERVKSLLTEVFRGGLLVSLAAEDVRRVDNLVQMQGDPLRGRDVFLSAAAQCAKCHKLEGVGGQVGPDLSKIWETHTVAKIMESIIDPSKEIKEGYPAWTVSTARGQVFSGLKIKDDATEVVLRDAEGKDIRIPTDDVDEKIENRTSLMPEGVISQLSFEQFIDLVAFLKSREAQTSLSGMLLETLLLGPFPTDHPFDARLYESAATLVPLPQQGKSLAWKPLTAGRDGTFDLRQTHPYENAAVFAVAQFDSPSDQAVSFDVWFDDEIEVTLNGESVHKSSNVHTLETFTSQAKAGPNRVLIKVINGGTDFAFRFFVRGEGVRITPWYVTK